MNQLYQQLNPKTPIPNNIRQMIQNFKMLSNPQAAVQNMLNNNPQVKSLLQAANGNPEKAFRDLARQMNVDADEFIGLFK